MRIRVNFEWPEDICYLGHVDFTRTVARGLRRTSLPLKFTEGFNSRVKVEMGFPLSVGMLGEDEFFDFYLSEDVAIDKIKALLDTALDGIINIKQINEIPDNLPSITSLPAILTHFIYAELKEMFSEEALEKKLSAILEMPNIVVLRQKKGVNVKKDVRPFIKDIKLLEINNASVVFLFSSHFTSRGSIKIDEIEDILNKNGIPVDFDYIVRKKTVVKYKGKYVSPFGLE
ncbi:MAG: TIGR03936 family radical SAM-associated protein [Caldisericota bacterium]|nr:TIGR03936 family radical SAM-associated protein [Caldisericota bacterium]